MSTIPIRRRVPDFRRYVVAVARVERLLHKVTAALERAGVTYAVIGGNAVAAWVATVDEGAVRSTKDVDLLLRRRDLGAVAVALEQLGLEPIDVLGVTMFVDRRRPNPRTGVHVVIANERIRPHYASPAPDPSRAVRAAAGFRVLGLRELVAMKLEAFRDIDRVHVRDLAGLGLLKPALVRRLTPEHRRRLRSISHSE